MARVPLIIALALAVGATAATAAPRPRLGFTLAPARALQDRPVTVQLAVRPLRARCSLSVRYADGSRQSGLTPVRARRGVARWTWVVPTTADAGPARLTAFCRGVGRRTRTLMVVGATAVPAPKLVVAKQGFSQRPHPSFSSRSYLSYGVVLSNPDLAYDVHDVDVLINALSADDRVVASKTEDVDVIAAGGEFALGGSQTIGPYSVSRLEVVLVRAERRPKQLRLPAVQGIRVVGGTGRETGFVKEVYGEVVNVIADAMLTRTKFSVVAFDAAGAVIGGGTGTTRAALPPGARVLVSATGMRAVPVQRAVSFQFSFEPTWEPAGT